MRRNSHECQIYRPVHALVIQSLIVPAAILVVHQSGLCPSRCQNSEVADRRLKQR